jgi:hypothetical protein
MAGKAVVTPQGKANWVYLLEPFTQFDPEGVYKITLELDKDDADVMTLIDKIEEKSAGLTHRPFEVDPDTGNYHLKAASKYKPQVFDSANQPIGDGVNVGAGSVVKIAVEPKAYEGFGGGIKLYLKAVQVFELVEQSGSSAESFGFDEGEGGFTLPDGGFDAVVAEADSKPDSDLDW